MRVGIMSDIHVDMGMQFSDMYGAFDQDVDVLIIAGDIGNRTQTVSFIDMLLDIYTCPIVLVLGNHDYYNHFSHTVDDVIAQYKNDFKDDNVHVLVRGEYVNIHGFNIVGATLWSDLAERYNPLMAMQTQLMAANSITDFEMIGGMDFNTMRAEYTKDRSGIIESLATLSMSNTMVVTHFSPSIDYRNEDYKLDPLAYYFCGYMDDVIENFQPAYWVYGHTHGNNEPIERGDTVILCNQVFGRLPRMKVVTV